MKNKLYLLIFLSHLAFGAQPVEIVLAYETESNPPYCLGNSKQIDFKKPGVTVELLKKLENRLNIKISFKRVPWKRAILMLKTNNANGIFHASYKQKRTEFGVYPMRNNVVDKQKAIMANSYYLYKYKKSKLSWQEDRLMNLKGKIGVTKGFSIVDKLKKNSTDIEEFNNIQSALDKLNYKAIQGVINLENRVDSILKKHSNKYKNIDKDKNPVSTKPYYLIFSKEFYSKNSALAEKIWSEIKLMKSNGEYDEIKEKYL